MKKRASWHDYYAPGVYMLTLTVAGRRPLLGALVELDEPYISYSDLGKAIVDNEIWKISKYYPMVEVWWFVIMPDHIHMIVKVKEQLPEGKHLGKVVTGFKSGCNHAYWERFGKTGDGLFEKGYNDRILHRQGQLEAWKKYIKDNPRRLMLKRRHPDLFRKVFNVNIAGRACVTVGNRFLLDIPDKVPVVVHRADSDDVYGHKKREWLECGERGGVLVSAAISKREKEVMHEAMVRGYNIIFLRNNGFPEFYKPAGRAFDACVAGHLLMASPYSYHSGNWPLTRTQCLLLNAMAEAIAGS